MDFMLLFNMDFILLVICIIGILIFFILIASIISDLQIEIKEVENEYKK